MKDYKYTVFSFPEARRSHETVNMQTETLSLIKELSTQLLRVTELWGPGAMNDTFEQREKARELTKIIDSSIDTMVEMSHLELEEVSMHDMRGKYYKKNDMFQSLDSVLGNE